MRSANQAGRLGAFRRDHRIPRQTPTMMQDQDAQGAKPGEGGQLPGHKVDADHRAGAAFDARVGLISPPAASRTSIPIEDLGAADLRSQERQSGRSWCRSSWSPKSASARSAAGVAKARAGPRHHRWLRRRHRRVAPYLDQARRQPLGNRPCRNPPDPGARAGCAAASWCRSTAASARTRRGDRRIALGPTSSASPPPP